MVIDTLEVKIDVKLSLWSAIKLRIAGLNRNNDASDYFTTRNRYGKK
ncbi:MAG TPA: hypothetical protein PKL77_07170 [Candidatus Omnitrophota bacterium]|nr:hypothetical protein [Candidatus Omnitrophota bacterium]